jgi:hypothetical protein
VQGEGSIDPLGLATLADHLADWILPGMTARMWRARFLTAMAVASVTVEPFGEELAKDGVTPPWLAFEWYYVEAMARLNDADGNQLRRIPGIEKARQALRDGVPLSADRYLKTPKVFGFHGVYKRLARHTDVVDDDLALGENGHRLLRLWEAEQGLQGFSGPDRPEGEAARICRALRDAIGDALREGQAQRGGSWLGASFFVRHLVPHRPGPREAAFLWELLVAASAAPRGEVFDLLRRLEVRREFLEVGSQRTLLTGLRGQVSPELARRIDAIESYEAFCRPLQEAWDHLRRLSTLQAASPLRAGDVAGEARFTALAGELPRAIARAREALAESPVAGELEGVAPRFEEVRAPADLFHTLWAHHVEVQRRKPPEGKRPWFEETADGGLIVRPPYRLDEAVPPQEEFVHPYRLFAVASFINDLMPEG